MITAGDIVMYAHPEDGKPWPAMVLEVVDVEVTDGAGAETDPLGSVEVVCLLQIFRPRGTDWKSSVVEGTTPGTWHRRQSV